MPKEKRNHFVSKGLVQFWARPNGQVFFWDKISGKEIELRNPKSVHYEDYLYARWEVDGTRDMSAERALAIEVDNHAPEFVRQLIQRFPAVLPLSDRERHFVVRLVLRSILRNPTIIRTIAQTWQVRIALQLLKWSRRLSSRSGDDEGVRRMGEDRVVRAELNHIAATKNINNIIHTYENKMIAFMIPDLEDPNFVLGSQPYLIDPHPRAQQNGHVGSGLASISLVIHPRLMVTLMDGPEREGIVPASYDDVCRINGLFIKYCNKVVMVNATDAHGAWYMKDGSDDEIAEVVVSKVDPVPSSEQ